MKYWQTFIMLGPFIVCLEIDTQVFVSFYNIKESVVVGQP